MKKFALIGRGISHSLSPALFRAAYGDDKYTYSLLDCKDVDEAVRRLLCEGYSGANVTSPFKESILEFCKRAESAVSEIGATNVVIVDRGELSCYNTDYIGVKESLRPYRNLFDSAVIIGAGGAAKAAAYALKTMNINFIVANRTFGKALSLSKQFDCAITELNNISKEIKPGTAIIYTIDHPLDLLREINLSKTVIFEANYKSPLFKPENCLKYISGKEWLVQQAIPAFKLFTQTEPSPEPIYKIVDDC